MRILVTGALGYIGTALYKELTMSKAYDVIGLDAGFASASLSAMDPDIPVLRKDVRDVDVNDLEGIGAVIHLAGLPCVPEHLLSRKLIYEINHMAVVRLASLAKFANVPRFIYVSSNCASTSQLQAKSPNETPLHTSQNVASDLQDVELDLARLADLQFSPSFVRPAAVYGPAGNMRFDLGVNRLVYDACASHSIWLPSEPAEPFPIVHIDDLVSALMSLLALPRNEVHMTVENVVSLDADCTLSIIARKVASLVPGTTVHIGENVSLQEYGSVSIAKLVPSTTGFSAQHTLQNRLRDMVEATLNLISKAGSPSGEIFSRRAALERLIVSGEVSQDLRWRTKTNHGRPAAR